MTPGAVEFLAEGGGDRDAVEHRVDRDLARAFDPGEHLLLLDRDAELLVDAQNFGIDLVEAAERRLLLRLGVIICVLIIDRRDGQLGPVDLLHLQPGAIGLEAPLEQPFGLVLLGRDEADGVFVEPLGREILLDVGDEAPFVILGQRFAGLRVGDGDGVVHCRAPAKAGVQCFSDAETGPLPGSHQVVL